MPKSCRIEKRDGRIIKITVPTKFRIGTRKSGKSANLMSKVELEAVIEDTNKARYHGKARAVLALRAA